PSRPSSVISSLSLHVALPIFGDLLCIEHLVRSAKFAQGLQMIGNAGLGNIRGRLGDGFRVRGASRPCRRIASGVANGFSRTVDRSEEHTSELQSRVDLVCRLL